MNAALSKDQELVEFEWDNLGGGKVTIYCFDYRAETGDAYSINTETVAYARAYWEGLVESGFRRVKKVDDVPETLDPFEVFVPGGVYVAPKSS